MKHVKRIRAISLTMAGLVILAACSPGADPVTTGNGIQATGSSAAEGTTALQPGSQSLPPVESRKANTSYAPAWPGQTRVAGVRTAAAYDIEILTEDLLSPWSIKPLPDGRFIVTEKAGSLRIITADGTVSKPIGGFPEVDSSGQGGLLDVLVAEDFERSRVLYFTLAEKTGEGSLTAVGKARLAADESAVTDFEIIFRAIPYDGRGAHFGSRLIFDAKGDLIVTTGERQSASNRVKAQDLENGWGKVLRIDPEGRPAAGNPFMDTAGAMPEIYSYGHRNIQGLAMHPKTGELWISEMGPRGGDELNLVEAGKNYGWPVISYGIEYIGTRIGEGITHKDGMEQPVYYWDPVLAPSGMTFYSSDAIPEWENNLFIGGLAGQHIARLILDGHRVIGEERLLAEEGQRFRDITEAPDGALYTVTDSGHLYRIGPAR